MIVIKRVVYLTFDDGPFPVSHQIMDLLKKHNAKATFFMLEPQMRQYSDVVERLFKEGHSLGLHGVTHNKDIIYNSGESFINEMNEARKTLKELTGLDSKLIRAPYGSVPLVTEEIKIAIQNSDYKMFDWTVDSRDWYFKDTRFVKSVIKQVKKIKSDKPIIVLLHEFVPTYEHLEPLLDYFTDNDYEYKILDKNTKTFNFLKI